MLLRFISSTLLAAVLILLPQVEASASPGESAHQTLRLLSYDPDAVFHHSTGKLEKITVPASHHPSDAETPILSSPNRYEFHSYYLPVYQMTRLAFHPLII